MDKKVFPLTGLITEIYGNENAVVSPGIVIEIDGVSHYTEKKKWDATNVTPLKLDDAEYICFLFEPLTINEDDLVWLFGNEYVEALNQLAEHSERITEVHEFLTTLPVYRGYRIMIGEQKDYDTLNQKISDEMEPILHDLIINKGHVDKIDAVRVITVGTLGNSELVSIILRGVISVVKTDYYGYDFMKMSASYSHPTLNFDRAVSDKLDELQQKDE